jgi:hypothetical protein
MKHATYAVYQNRYKRMVGRLKEIREVFHGVFHVNTNEYVVKFLKYHDSGLQFQLLGTRGTHRDSGGI